MTHLSTATRHVGGVLMIYHRPSMRQWTDADNVRENITAFPRHSAFPFRSLNTDHGFPPRLSRLRFDAVLVHYSVFLHGPAPYLLEGGFRDYLAATEAFKIATFQDEHHWCEKRFSFLRECGIDCVYTMLEEPYGEQIYGRYAPGVSRVVSNLPGYVGHELMRAAKRHRRPDSARTIEVGYRGRPMPAYMGEGAMEKTRIGEGFAELAEQTGLDVDIDVSEGGRLYAGEWHDFVGSSRAQLGVESGVSCFDAEDEVRHEYEQLAADGHEPTLLEMQAGRALPKWDWKTPYRTISPRHFEAAAMDVCQILFEGHYSGAMKPMRHYIPLKKDFSNFEEAIEHFRDAEVRRELTANAHSDLISSGAYSYESFIPGFDKVLADAGLTPQARGGARSPAVRRALALDASQRWRRFHLTEIAMFSANHPRAWRVIWVASRPVAPLLRGLRTLLGRATAGRGPAERHR